MATIKRTISLLLSIILLISVFISLPITTNAATSGTTGDCAWELNDDGVLTISGSGLMDNYTYYGAPWNKYRDSIISIIIKNGVKNVGSSAFDFHSNVINVVLPDSITSIGYGAFAWCEKLSFIKIPDSVVSIDGYAFGSCKLTSINIPKSISKIGDYAFDCYNGNAKIKDIYYAGSKSEWEKINISKWNDDLCTAKLHYNSSGAYNAQTTIMSLFKQSRQDCYNISNNMGFFKTTGVSLITSIKEGLGAGIIAKELMAKAGYGKSTEEEIVDEVTMEFLSEYFSAYDPSSPLEADKKLIKRITSLVNIFTSMGKLSRQKSLKKQVKSLKLHKELGTTFSEDKIIQAFDKLDKAGKIVKWGSEAIEKFSMFMVLEQYNIDVIKELKTDIAKFISGRGSWIYQGLSNIEKATKDPITYIANITTNEALVNKIGDMENFVPNKEVAKVVKACSKSLCLIYDIVGGKYAQDYMKVNISTAMAATLNFALEKQGNAKDLHLMFDFALVAHKKSLKYAMNIEKKGSKRYNACSNDLKKLNTVNFVQFLSQCEYGNTGYIVKGTKSKLLSGAKSTVYKTGNESETENTFSYDDYIIIDRETSIINDNSYSDLSDKKGIIISESVESIGEKAFENCSGCEEVIFGDNVQTISKEAFKNCSSISDFYLPVSLENIGDEAFANCRELTTLEIGENTISIGSKAFSGCSNLSEVSFYSSNIIIQNDAFENCSENLVIRGFDQSTAKTFAEENGFRFEPFEKTAVNLSIVNLPTKTEYEYSEEISTDGLELKAEYSDGTSENITEGWIVEGNTYETGKTTVNVYFKLQKVSYDITVNNRNSQTIELNNNSIKLLKGNTFTIDVTNYYDSFEGDKLYYSSNNPEIATVEDGIIVAKNYGNTKITVYDEYNNSAECNVAVVNEVNDIISNEEDSYIIFTPDETAYYDVQITYDNETNTLISNSGETICNSTNNNIRVYLCGNEVYLIEVGTESNSQSDLNVLINKSENQSSTEPTTTPEPTTEITEPATESPTLPESNESVYVAENGERIELADKMARAADDTALTGIANEFKNLEILGVQKKKEESKRDIRFVTVINREIVEDAEDYGYIAVGASNMETARSVVEGYTLDKAPAKHIFSCKGTSNNISGNYGKNNTDTKYKYVTFSVNNIGDNSVAIMFYVKDKNGNVFYAPYTNATGTFNSCSTDWETLIKL